MNSLEHITDLSFRVVVYRDDADWVAHALEADIIGYGSSPEEAAKELFEALECQITFAFQRGDSSLIEKEAPEDIVRLWESTRKETIHSIFSQPAMSRQVEIETGKKTESLPGPLAKFYSLSGQDLDAFRKNRMELVCG